MKPELTPSDRFVANWIIDRIESLTDEQHQRIAGPRIKQEPSIATDPRAFVYGKRKDRES